MRILPPISAVATLLLCAPPLWPQAPVTPPPGARGAQLGRASQQPVASAAAPAVKSAGLDLPALQIDLTQINESRSSNGNGSINLTLNVTGNGLPPGTVVRQVNVLKAADQEGRSINLPAGRGRINSPGMMSSMLSGSPGTAPMRATASLSPISIPRSTTGLSFVEGTIEVFVPSESLGSMIRVPNITSHLGRVEHPVLDKHGIVFHFLGDKPSFDEAQELMGGAGGSGARQPDLVTAYGTYYRDAANRIVASTLMDKSGTPIRSTSSSGFGGGGGAMLTTNSLTAPMPADTQLVLYIAVPESLATVPFRLENIELP